MVYHITMGYRIKEVSDISGVSIRMLRHYDKTGLLKPDVVLDNGYRDYSEENLERLQRIMYLKELDFSIPDMRRILAGGEGDMIATLQGQADLLVEKKERLEGIIELIHETIENGRGRSIMDKFKAFDMKELEKHKEKYAEETKQRYAGTKAYDQSVEKTGAYTEGDWERISIEADGIYAGFAAAMSEGPESPEAIAAAREWQAHISKYYYECTDEIFLGLADMYVADERFAENINKHAEGLASFMSAAMKAAVK